MEEVSMTFLGFHVGIIDLVLVVLGLLFAITGFKNGFLKEIVGVGAFIGAIALSYLLAHFVREIIISQTSLYTIIYDNLLGSVFTGNALYDTVIDGSQPGALGYLTDGLIQIGLPSFLAGPLAGTLIEFNGTLGAALSTSAAELIITIIAYLATFLVGWLLLFIILKQLVHLTKSVGVFKFVDSILGLALGVARAALIIGVLFLITIPLSFVVPEIQTFLNSDLDLLNPDTFSIGKFLYQFVIDFIGTIL
jgi:uncharacterized membrane protein required for colicin V production